MEGKKLCRQCDKLLPEADFPRNRRICKPCKKIYDEQFRAVNYKFCSGCKVRRAKENFDSLKRGSKCALCRGEEHHKGTTRVEGERRVCEKCQNDKPIRAFNISTQHSPTEKWYKPICRVCERQHERALCRICRKKKYRSEFPPGRWKERLSRHRAIACTACEPPQVKYDEEAVTYDYAFARDLLGWSHAETLKWLAKGYGGSDDLYYLHLGSPEAPKDYTPWEPDPWKGVQSYVIEYTDLQGNLVRGTVWCEGPKDKTVWVIRPDQTYAVVRVTTRKGQDVKEEIEYQIPKWIHPIPKDVLQAAEDVVELYRVARKELEGLDARPIGMDHQLAVAILKQAEAHRQGRKPFIEAHTGRAPISIKRIRELTKDDIER